MSIAKRVATDFLRNYPADKTITVIFTTRSTRKSTDTLQQLLSHLERQQQQQQQQYGKAMGEAKGNEHRHGGGQPAAPRVHFFAAQVDLTDLRSVAALARLLKHSFPKIDAAIFNAGMGAFLGIDWLACFVALARDWIGAVTHPEFKLQELGRTCSSGGFTVGEVFCANVFGHYFLAHELMGLLRRGRGRIVWVSSLEAYSWTLDIANDIDGVRATHSYESSKRLTDVLALTSGIAATKPWTRAFFRDDDLRKEDSDRGREEQEQEQEQEECGNVKAYVCHPGVCATAMIAIHPILFYCMMLSFYIARWAGSPWHTVSTHTAANAPVHLALASEEELVQSKADRVKLGSGTDRSGSEVLRATPVDDDGTVEFQELGRGAWKRLEELRVACKTRLES